LVGKIESIKNFLDYCKEYSLKWFIKSLTSFSLQDWVLFSYLLSDIL
jgi:hypothetical protein